MHLSWARAARSMLLVTAALLAIPLVAMQFTAEVNWGLGDFIAAGALLFTAGMAYHLASNVARTARQRLVLVVLIAVIVAIVWAELAVGIFD